MKVIKNIFKILPFDILDDILKIVEDEEKEEKEKKYYKSKFNFVMKELLKCVDNVLNINMKFFWVDYYRRLKSNYNEDNYRTVLNHFNFIFSHFGERFNYPFNASRLFRNHPRKLKFIIYN
tara:strand:- start:385 stop:747 length:363 start_codon:yes stop_codon:yes gene_type:complete